MSNMLIDTMHAAEQGMKSAKKGTMHALETAKDDLDSAKKSTMHALGTAMDGAESAKESTLSTFANGLALVLKGVAATAGIITTLQKLDRDDGLAWLGLSRRKSPLLTLAILGAGAAVGAGVALWFAPMAGADLRNALLGRTKAAAKNVEAPVEAIAKKVETKVEGAAEYAVGTVDGAGHNGKPTHA